VRHGTGQHFMGTGPVFLLASALGRLAHPPVVVGSLAMVWGYLRGFLTGAPRYDDPEFRRFLRRYQWRSLRRGKAVATAETDAEMAAIWDPPRS
jgi:hypothetical protein